MEWSEKYGENWHGCMEICKSNINNEELRDFIEHATECRGNALYISSLLLFIMFLFV